MLNAERSFRRVMPTLVAALARHVPFEAEAAVHFHGLAFIAPELNGRVGQKVEVRYTPHDDRQIEIFMEGTWLATGRPQNALTEAERDRVLAQRRADVAEQGRRQRQASRLAVCAWRG